ncbi:MAG: bifunctional precorrin-2 dehydrogenase/sirohydrochlorin ferrochelatase [bacterium]
MPRYYPVSLNLKNTRCLVVGGGKVAERKVHSLLSCGAVVTLISPEITSDLNEKAQKGQITYKKRYYKYGDCQGMRAVIVATDSERINREAAEEAMAANCLVNVVDQPHISNFIVPATLRQGDLQISISTNGKSPALARRIREKLEKEFGPEYSEFLKLIDRVRKKALVKIPDPEKRRELFYNLVDSDLLQLIREGNDEEVKKRLEGLY